MKTKKFNNNKNACTHACCCFICFICFRASKTLAIKGLNQLIDEESNVFDEESNVFDEESNVFDEESNTLTSYEIKHRLS